ncbi:MAG: hypothetical protein GX299_03295 [Epulopiscium sp.]|jgi:hypothetical protein|nr:hypothetical protein [Candidatus Epulonipiscium sp.]
MKKQLLELLSLLEEAHEEIKKGIEKEDRLTVAVCLEECQNTAIAIGEKIDEIEGEGTTSVESLESYCELTYTIHEQTLGGESLNPFRIYNKLQKSYLEIYDRVNNDIPEVREVVFLPYKASMWDSLESVWKKAADDPLIDAKVIPIPYYDKNPDGSFRQLHYEGAEFPAYVPITHYDSYDFEKCHPDEIYIHNPYDDRNTVTSVHPFFFSKNLKQYTDKLIYIPYFVLEEINLKDKNAIKAFAYFAQVPAVMYADEVIVQSENTRQFYIESMVLLAGEKERKTYEQKIKGTGSPKIEKIKSMSEAEIHIPDSWNKYLYRADGRKKKVILYNTSISAFLQQSEQMLYKMEQVFNIFKSRQNDVALLWRPHPLMEATIISMRPQLWNKYQQLVENYKQGDIGIYDDSADMNRALVLADAYYGDGSSLVTLCKAIHLPIMIQNASVIYTDSNYSR